MAADLTYASYAGKIKLKRLDDGLIQVLHYQRHLDKGWHQMTLIEQTVFEHDQYDQARHQALCWYEDLLATTKLWVAKELAHDHH